MLEPDRSFDQDQQCYALMSRKKSYADQQANNFSKQIESKKEEEKRFTLKIINRPRIIKGNTHGKNWRSRDATKLKKRGLGNHTNGTVKSNLIYNKKKIAHRNDQIWSSTQRRGLQGKDLNCKGVTYDDLREFLVEDELKREDNVTTKISMDSIYYVNDKVDEFVQTSRRPSHYQTVL